MYTFDFARQFNAWTIYNQDLILDKKFISKLGIKRVKSLWGESSNNFYEGKTLKRRKANVGILQEILDKGKWNENERLKSQKINQNIPQVNYIYPDS